MRPSSLFLVVPATIVKNDGCCPGSPRYSQRDWQPCLCSHADKPKNDLVLSAEMARLEECYFFLGEGAASAGLVRPPRVSSRSSFSRISPGFTIGFAIYSSQPAAKALALSPTIACAVTAI